MDTGKMASPLLTVKEENDLKARLEELRKTKGVDALLELRAQVTGEAVALRKESLKAYYAETAKFWDEWTAKQDQWREDNPDQFSSESPFRIPEPPEVPGRISVFPPESDVAAS